MPEMTPIQKLAELNTLIDAARKAEKIEKKIKNMKLTHKTAHKYYSLQELYMNTIKGQ